MKLFIIILLAAVLVFAFIEQKNQNAKRPITYRLPSNKRISIDYSVYDQMFTYYFSAKDSTKSLGDSAALVPCRVIGYDENGKEKEIIYNWYESYVPATSIIFYDSIGRVELRYYRIDDKRESGKLIKTVYFYNEFGKVGKEISYDFEKRIRKDDDKGLGRTGGCLVSEEDYDKHKSWAIRSVWDYKYDDKGRLIEKFAPICYSTRNKYTYRYNQQGKLIEERSLENDELSCVESHSYYDGGREFTRICYEKGQRRKDLDGKNIPVDTFRYTIDKFGNEMEELVIEEGGRIVNKDRKYYDQGGRMIRHEMYDGKDQLLGFYLCKYKAGIKPITKNFFVDDN